MGEILMGGHGVGGDILGRRRIKAKSEMCGIVQNRLHWWFKC